MVRWLRWHCPPDTGFEIRALAVWGRAHYISVTESPTQYQPRKLEEAYSQHMVTHVGYNKDPVQKDSQLSPKREIALSAVPRYWELELMLLPSIKYDFTILRRVIMTLILIKTIHTLHHKNRKNKYYRRFTSIFYPIICWLVINTF